MDSVDIEDFQKDTTTHFSLLVYIGTHWVLSCCNHQSCLFKTSKSRYQPVTTSHTYLSGAAAAWYLACRSTQYARGSIRCKYIEFYNQQDPLWCSWLSRPAVKEFIVYRKVTGSIPVEGIFLFGGHELYTGYYTSSGLNLSYELYTGAVGYLWCRLVVETYLQLKLK